MAELLLPPARRLIGLIGKRKSKILVRKMLRETIDYNDELVGKRPFLFGKRCFLEANNPILPRRDPRVQALVAPDREDRSTTHSDARARAPDGECAAIITDGVLVAQSLVQPTSGSNFSHRAAAASELALTAADFGRLLPEITFMIDVLILTQTAAILPSLCSVVYVAELAELVHEEIHAGPCRADARGQDVLTDPRNDRLRFSPALPCGRARAVCCASRCSLELNR